MNSDRNLNRIIAKRYRLVELIGTGAMGQVYRAEDKVLGNATVAVKFLSQTLLNDKMRERFEREATICANLAEKSIHIVGVRDYGIDENKVPYYIMEFLQGRALNDIIQEEEILLPRFLSLTRQICLGLDCAHKGIIFKGKHSPIIHRDIKPSNIYVLQDPTIGELVKVLDFGIAKLIQSDRSQTHSFMGTLAYCSPEQMEGKELDNRSDIYSLGIMMYEMLTNEMPILPETSSFPGWYKAHHEFPPKSFNPRLHISQDLQNVILKCLAKKPEARFQSVGEIIPILEKIPHQEQQNHYPEKPSAPKPPQLGSFPSQVTQTPTIISKVDEFYLQASWPMDKPQQKIVFPKTMNVGDGIYPTLWVMLEQQDIINRMSSIRYNQFLYLGSPHPMVLWITVLYHQEHGPRWLPCYLDFKTDSGLQIGRLLSDIGNYAILFFGLNEPQKCRHVMKSTIAPHQRDLLKQWSQGASGVKHYGKPQISKRLLKQEFEKLKPKIVEKLVKLRASQQSR
ncbi:MAG: serine/threonine protein kinase [Gloeocapsa sp. DLM2.Bin57]|nr:MAG: serine/threonine protein kinase [Gloeocapsa sp. DLM2.Bin57]